MNSAIYHGEVFHCRIHPKDHKFKYRMSMVYADLDELNDICSCSHLCGFRWFHPLRFDRKDFHGDPNVSVKQAVYQTVKHQLGLSLEGPVRVLSHWRFMGFNFNPLATYFCFDKEGKHVVAVVAEVTNTPWLERKAYALPANNGKVDVRFEKGFTVSPFNPINMEYHWRSTMPGDNLNIDIHSYYQKKLNFNAKLSMERVELTRGNMNKLVYGVSKSAIHVVFSIYWQALKLFFKGVPFLGKDSVKTS